MSTRSITASQAGTPFSISLSRPFQALLRSLQRWREADRIRIELERLGELGLADLGVTRNDIPAIVRGTYRNDQPHARRGSLAADSLHDLPARRNRD